MKNNPVYDYWQWMNDNRRSVCTKVYKTYEYIISYLEDPESEWEYDEAKANHAVTFIERFCKHSKGKMGGKPFILELWQKAKVAATFGIVHKITGERKYQRVVLIVARKNGKSTLSAAEGLYLFIADGEPGPEIYSVATKKDQAKIIWLEAKRMVKKSPALSKRIKPLVAELTCDLNDGIYKPVGRDSDTLDGLNVHGATMDEIHAWTDKNLYDVIVDGTSARDEPLILITTTAGTVRGSVYDDIYDEAERTINGYFDPDGYKDERSLYLVYELDDRKTWTDESTWMQANPGLGTIKKTDALRDKVNKAKANSKLVKNLLTKDFDIPETTSEAWLTFETLDNRDTFDIAKLKPRYCVGGIDLAATTDLTCATIVFKLPDDEKTYVKQMYWLPGDLIEIRSQEDKIPYDVWEERGLLRRSGTNKVNYKDLTKWFLEVQNEMDCYIFKIGYDRWSATYLVDELIQYFGKTVPVPVAQGAKTFSNPMKRLESDLRVKKINYDNNPITKWCLSNAAIKTDTNDNIALVKTSNPRRRIDGVASLMDAVIALEENYDEYMSLI
ncbi:terminase large subunit [Peptoniphilus sp.]|jgi:phage terminase large subunit-like protein|uniref:terminase large subunit n=1 Tax=Peptoniphilus sp. TaxID=1971214 RepID=UPI003D924CAD